MVIELTSVASRGSRILCILLFVTTTLCEPLSAFSVTITVEGGCGSTYVVGDSIIFYVRVSEGAYVSVWVVTSGGSKDILRNKYLCAGTHDFSGAVGSSEGTHTLHAKAKTAYGDISGDSCSYYVSDTPLPTFPSPQDSTEADSDGDGIPDNTDQCDNPDCNEIDPQGCPKDSDEDGVWDCDDACDFFPGLPDNDGCPEFTEDAKAEDSDGDGWSDEQEQRAGTDPYDVDTDRDGIWDPKDPNPLKAEEADTEVVNQQTQILSREQFGFIPPMVVAAIFMVGYYFFKRKRQESRKMESIEEMKKIKRQESRKMEQIRKLKAKYVYGELSKDEYKRKLEELERSAK